MTERRSRGDGGLFWSEVRQRWIAETTVGYTSAGKRITRKASGRTKTEAKNKLKKIIRDNDDGLTVDPGNYTVADAVNDWLEYGLGRRSDSTRSNYTTLARKHIVTDLGARKLKALTAEDIDRWLAAKAKLLSTRTLRLLHSILNRAVIRSQARNKVKHNVVTLCEIPAGRAGRRSKSLTLDQAKAVLVAAEHSRLRAYIDVSLLTGARTEELRALTWDHVDLVGDPGADPPVPPSIEVWHSVRDDGDTKTPKSRRTLALPVRCVWMFRYQREQQERDQVTAGKKWHETGLVFTSKTGLELDAANVRRAFRRVLKLAGLNPNEWTPRELRHSFVSLLSSNGVTTQDIADLCGHSGTTVTERVYRHELRPVLLNGAVAMDRIFAD